MTQSTLPAASQIRWQCRRGMLELDILLLSFFDRNYESLPLDQQKIFVELLTFSDQELYGWLIGRDEPKPTLQPIVQKIRDLLWKR